MKLGHDRERIKGHDGAYPSSAEIVRDVSATLDPPTDGFAVATMTRAEEEQDTTEHLPPGQKSEMSRLRST